MKQGKLDVGHLKKLFERAKQYRQPWESYYQDCYDYAMPGRVGFFNRSPQADSPVIYDETAVVAVPEFASQMQAGLVPNYARWFQLEAGSDIPEDQREEVNDALEAITNDVMEVINNSNFSEEVHEAMIDLSVGTACLQIDDGGAVSPVRFTAIPLNQLFLDSGHDDRIDTYIRAKDMTLEQIENLPYVDSVPQAVRQEIEKKSSDVQDKRVNVVFMLRRDWSNPDVEVHDYYVFLPDHDHMLHTERFEGIGSSPMVAFRWSKLTGEVWGRGPLYNVMPAVRTANLVVQLVLENAEMAIAGVYTVEDDGVVSANNIRIAPGTVIPVAPGSRGLQSVGASGDFSVADLVLSEMRNNIKRGLYNDQLGNPNTTPMSATEVQQRMADLSRRIGSAFGRLQNEFVNRVVQRVVHIMKKRGMIELPSINGREIKIIASSPLSKAQAVEDINAVNNWLTLLNTHFGPQLTALEVDSKEVAEFVRERMGLPSKLKRKEQDKAQIAQAFAQPQQGSDLNGAGQESQSGLFAVG